MCGIAGIVGLQLTPLKQDAGEVVRSMIRVLEHRGPDHQGFWSSDFAVLGSCRLAILGLEPASNQPLKSAESECIVVFNGEIYNYLELRQELQSRGHVFVSTGDTEVIVHSYEEWGVECLNRFNGMFAFAICDPAKGLIFFARDRYGVKPFYYAQTGSLFLFASEPKALIASGLLPSEPDEHAVLDYLEFGVTDASERTFFQGVRQLLPGHFGTVGLGKVAITKWYDVATSVQTSPPDSIEGSAPPRFRELLESSVTLRMRSDVPVGILLSGGVDSSSIAVLAGRLPRPDGLKAYTVAFPGSRLNELEHAEAVAREVHIPLVTESSSVLDEESVRRCVQDQYEPMLSPSVVAQWLVMRAVHRSGVRVLLSGQGADEVLAGYEYFDGYAVFDCIAGLRFGTALRHLLNERNLCRMPRILAQTLFVAAPPRLKRRLWRKTWLRSSAHDGSGCRYFEDLVACRDLKSSLVFHVRSRLPELLRYEDRNSMAFSIEARQPFLDYRLVEFVLGREQEELAGGGVRKRLLRLAMADILPRGVLNRREKIGFQTPPEWLQTASFRQSLLELTKRPPEALSRLIDFSEVRRLLSAPRSPRDLGDLWRIYNTLLWYGEVCCAQREMPRETGSDVERSAIHTQSDRGTS